MCVPSVKNLMPDYPYPRTFEPPNSNTSTHKPTKSEPLTAPMVSPNVEPHRISFNRHRRLHNAHCSGSMLLSGKALRQGPVELSLAVCRRHCHALGGFPALLSCGSQALAFLAKGTLGAWAQSPDNCCSGPSDTRPLCMALCFKYSFSTGSAFSTLGYRVLEAFSCTYTQSLPP